MPNRKSEGKIGILVGGGPAPGINGVISAATIEARNSGWEVIGIANGFEDLIAGNMTAARPLFIDDVSRIHLLGGSILNTSRANPTKKEKGADPERPLKNVVKCLEKLELHALITIGGDDTAHSASIVSAAMGKKIRIAHVPKTIDNDLPLPGNYPTFGFETARHYGVEILHNLMTDARTTRRWYFVVTMGRATGHLALGIGKAAGATVTIIPEEFGIAPEQKISLQHISDLAEATMLKRIAMGKPFGIVLLSEGLGERLDPHELERSGIQGLERDEHGHIRLSEVDLGRMVQQEVLSRFRKRNQKVTIVKKNLGYELRCAAPIPFDLEYTRDLGFWAVRFIVEANAQTPIGAMITIDQDKLNPMPFESFRDPKTGRPLGRFVDIHGESYCVARQYMIYLEKGDLDDEEMLGRLSTAAKISAEEFRSRYGYLARASKWDQAHLTVGTFE